MMANRKTKEMVLFLRKAQDLLMDIGFQFKPESKERAEELFEKIIHIPEAIEKDYKLSKSEFVFVTNLVAGLICSANADAIEKSEEAEINEH